MTANTQDESSSARRPRTPEGPGRGSSRPSHHELAVLGRLAGVPGVPQLVAGNSRTGSGVIEDLLEEIPGQSLAATLSGRPLDVAQLLRMAVELTTIIASIHRRGVVHKDINPATIVLHGSPPSLLVTNFSLATTVVEEHPNFTHYNDIIGSLPYLAPEQTGRTGWPVDQRADLYALGATLYELATGAPPFGRGDLLHLIHSHLTSTPVPVQQVNPDVPAAFSAIISHLLEKEPDRRYQSAEGVLHDLHRLRSEWERGGTASFVPGTQDFPWHLVPPSRLVGRESEITTLTSLFKEAAAGGCAAALVSGPPGVGKTALIDELRPLVTEAEGWILGGKFDQYQRDTSSEGVVQLASALARILLAEPEPELAAARRQLREALGGEAALLAAAVPEFRPVLDLGEVGVADPTNASVRLQQAALTILRILASERRPVVLFLDDLQWAQAASIAFVTTLLTAQHLRGVLLVGAFRDSEVEPNHPLAAAITSWQALPNQPHRLRLRNLSPADVERLLVEMLRMSPRAVAPLAEIVAARARGNPFDTVELINALRREGVLVPGDDGWTWEPGALRGFHGTTDVMELLGKRISGLGRPTQEVLEIVACLGGSVTLDLLRVALPSTPPAQPVLEPATAPATAPITATEPATAPATELATELEPRLVCALEEGLLVTEHGRAASVRFRHDRVQQAAYKAMIPAQRQSRHLEIARRLARSGQFDEIAALHYLPVSAELADPGERRRAAALLQSAAAQARTVGNFAMVDRYLAGALDLLEGFRLAADLTLYRQLELERHQSLTALGKFAQGDEFYQRILKHNDDPIQRASAADTQINSLLNRGEPAAAVELGIAELAELDHPVPRGPALGEAVRQGLDRLTGWVARSVEADDLHRPENTDPRIAAVSKIINRLNPAAYLCMHPITPWLVTEAARLWEKGGPTATLVGPLAHAAFATIMEREDYATGYAVVRRVVAVSEAHGYEPATSQARFLLSVVAAPWFEPREATIRQARQARSGLLRGGDLQNVANTYFATTPQLMECAPCLEDVLTDIETGIAFTQRIGMGFLGAVQVAYRQAVRALRGETTPLGGPDDSSFTEEAHLAALGNQTNAVANYHLTRALTAMIFGSLPEVDRHMAAALPLLPTIQDTLSITLANLLRALSLAERIRRYQPPQPGREVVPDQPPEPGDAALAQVRQLLDWFARRAAECPENYLHLRYLIEAELAWAMGNLALARSTFGQARRAIETLCRPWQQAFLAERFALVHLASGMEDSGRALLREARWRYWDWGATGKVTQLDQEHRFFRSGKPLPAGSRTRCDSGPPSEGTITAEAVDLLAVLRASQALSSETSLASLQQRVQQVLQALTGATSVHVLLRDRQEWILPGHSAAGEKSLAEPAAADQLPLSAVRYVERTRESLLLEDATRDDRFQRDPYLQGLRGCSLIVVPILTRGELRAMLVLENQHSRALLGTQGLDAVLLIAGQLSVSLENALVYAALEQKVAERTRALQEANEQLAQLAITDPLTGLANRRRLDDVLEAEWERALRTHSPLAMAMIDIDYFKEYNDRYGHAAGDQCLRKVATVIASSVRDTDTLARYGGEEFVLVLPNADSEAACRIAQRIREAVLDLDEPNPGTPQQRLTVSVGVATGGPRRSQTPEQLLRAADAELYRAKRHGRNQVSSAA